MYQLLTPTVSPTTSHRQLPCYLRSRASARLWINSALKGGFPSQVIHFLDLKKKGSAIMVIPPSLCFPQVLGKESTQWEKEQEKSNEKNARFPLPLIHPNALSWQRAEVVVRAHSMFTRKQRCDAMPESAPGNSAATRLGPRHFTEQWLQQFRRQRERTI